MSDRQHRDINAMKDTLLYMEYAKAYHFKKVRHVKTPYGDNCLTWVYWYYCHLNLKSHQSVDYTIKNPSAIAIGFLFTYSCLYCHLMCRKMFSAICCSTRCRGFKIYKRNYNSTISFWIISLMGQSSRTVLKKAIVSFWFVTYFLNPPPRRYRNQCQILGFFCLLPCFLTRFYRPCQWLFRL